MFNLLLGMGDCNKDSYSAQGCPKWAEKGECIKNDKWMWKNCCKSCKKRGKCENKSNSCQSWAKQGYCDAKENIIWMWDNCCSACAEGKDIKLIYTKLKVLWINILRIGNRDLTAYAQCVEW